MQKGRIKDVLKRVIVGVLAVALGVGVIPPGVRAEGETEIEITTIGGLTQGNKITFVTSVSDALNSAAEISGIEDLIVFEGMGEAFQNVKAYGITYNYAGRFRMVWTGVSASSIPTGATCTIKSGTFAVSGTTYRIVSNSVWKYNGSAWEKMDSVTPKLSHVTMDSKHLIYYKFPEATKQPITSASGKARLLLDNQSVNCYWSTYELDGEYGVVFHVPEVFLQDKGTFILKSGTMLGNHVVMETVYGQLNSSVSDTCCKTLTPVDNTLTTKGYQSSQTRYYLTIKAPGVTTGSSVSVPWEVNGKTKNLSIFRFDENEISFYHQPNEILDSASIVEDASGHVVQGMDNVSLVLRAGTVVDTYYLLNSVGVVLNGKTVTVMEVAENEIENIPDNDLPDAIVIPTDNYRNEKEARVREIYFTPYGSDSLPVDKGYSFVTGGIYVNDAKEPLGRGVTKYSGVYYMFLGNGVTLKAGDTVTVDGTLEADGYRVKIQRTTFVKGENGYIKVQESSNPYTSVLEDVYVDIDEQVYVIPSADTITVNNNAIDVETGRKLTTAGDYAVERVNGNIIYQQNVICYEIGDANADGKQNVVDLIATKNMATHTKKAEVKGADVNNDSDINDADLAVLRELLIEKTTFSDVREKYQEFVFGVISDTHIMGTTGEPGNALILKKHEKFKKALTYYKCNNAKLIIINGDISEFGSETSYAVIQDLIDEVYQEGEYRPQFIFIADNHEYWASWDARGASKIEFTASQQKFIDGLASAGVTQMNNHITIGGYDFIGISSDGMSGANATYNEATIQYLETELAKAANRDANKPIFVAVHQPETSVSSSKELYDRLREYPQVVLFTSHTHYLLNDERSIQQDDFTTVNTAATHYAWVRETYANFKEDSTPSAYNFAQGLLVKAKGATVEIDRYDIYNDQKIGETWTVTSTDCADGGKKNYTDATRQALAVAPTFVDGTSVSAEWVTLSSCTLTFASAIASDGDFVYRYKIVVKDADGTVIDISYYLNDFWHKDMPTEVTFTVSNLNCYKSYSFEITAEETYGVAGDSASTIIGEIAKCY